MMATTANMEQNEGNEGNTRLLLSRKKKKQIGVVNDERFESVLSDPRFDSLANKERKVVIDKRFKGMLSDAKFGTKCSVDMRGRRLNLENRNKLDRLYDVDSESSSNESGTDHESEIGDINRPVKLDLARGDGNITSSDESDDEWKFDEDKEDSISHEWGELDKSASRVEWATKRLALCNMEWDRVSANDIYVVLSSFKPPPPAAIRSVTIYLSDFGKERLAEEEKIGPRLPKLSEAIDDTLESDKRKREALRAYQLDRMRYYYAIIECDRMQTAATIYEQCDGVEFESSAVRMDLRFVPDNMTFEENSVKDSVTEEDVNLNVFKPKFFESAALSKSATKLTWDETDPERIKAEHEAFQPDADLEQLEHLIAPGSSDEDDDAEDHKKDEYLSSLTADYSGSDNAESFVDDKKTTGDVSSISLKTKTEHVDDASKEMITEENSKNADEKEDRRSNSDLTPWQKYLQKKKQKRKERKALIAELKRKQKAERGTKNEENQNDAKQEAPTDKHDDRIQKSEQNDESISNKIVDERDEATGFISDDRFAALYTDSAFAIDQSNPSFKSWKLAEKQAIEKKRKRKMHDGALIKAENDGVLSLADKLKVRTERLNEAKKKRPNRS
ncbi:unnamed protein product [Anisakis simplex]|uniref:NUC153 domain-containing protein n=1 Tax=Anisakis simplex TaxID=6269 RepID=A0A0M3K337_ANISI|nr:unnamed protein product [Anisakis simplex]